MKASLDIRRRALFWFGVSALLVFCRPLSAAETPPPLGGGDEDAGRLAELGERYRVAGDAAGLAAAEKKLADMKADRPAALLVLGRLLNSDKKFAEAAQVLEQALALKPEDFDAERELGRAYRELGQYGKAAYVLENALKHRPQEYVLTVELGICYSRMGRLDQAKEVFAQAKRINGKEAQAYIAQGYAYLDSGHDAQAKREFETTIALDTTNPLGYHHMGAYYNRRYQYQKAEEYYRQAVQMLESSPLANRNDLNHALSNLGLTLEAQEKFAEAEAVYRRGLEQPHPDSQGRSKFLASLGKLARAQGQTARAEQLYQQAMAACAPGLGCSRLTWANAAVKLGALYAAQGRKPEAEALAERIEKLCGDHPVDELTIEPILQLGELYAALGQSAKAEVLWRRMMTAREAMPTHWFMGRVEAALAGLYRNQGRLAEAEALYLKAIEVFKIKKDNAEAANALRGLAAVYEREGESQKAAAALWPERALVLKPDGFEAQSELGQAYSELGCGNPQARRGFESLIAVGTTSPFGYYHLGGRFDEHKHPHEAEACYRGEVARLAVNPLSNPSDRAAALQRLGSLLYEQGKSTEAETAFRQGLEKAGRGAEWRSIFLWSLGDASAAQNKPAQAKESFRAAVAACEPGPGCSLQGWMGATTALVDIYVAQGRKPEAEALAGRLEEAYAGVPVNAESIGVFSWLAQLYMKLGESLRAEVPLRRVLAARVELPADPDVADAESTLAGLYEAQGRWGELEALYLREIEAFKSHGDKAQAAGTLARLAAVYEEEGKDVTAAAARRQAEALRAQGGKS